MTAQTHDAPPRASARGLSIAVVVGLPAVESALSAGLLTDWRELAADDPRSSLFQAPGWCMEWYRAYAGTHEPHLITVREAGRLIGLVPMAIERRSGTFGFAGGTSADYRDIVALPDHRSVTVEALVDTYLSGGFKHPLSVGWIDESSDTPALLRKVCGARGLRLIERTHACWRWFPPAPEKPNGHKFLKWYQRHGTVRFEVIRDPAAWPRFRDEYFVLHSLRQLQAGRGQAFDDPVRRRFYDALFSSPEMESHVTGLYVNDVLVAAHFGKVWRRVLHLGPPGIRLDEEQRSPALVLLSWIIQNAESLGLAGFDMTIGDTEFKRRLGNRRFELTMVEVFPTASAYQRVRLRGLVMSAAKAVASRLLGPDAWKHTLLPLAERMKWTARRTRERGLGTTVVRGVRAAIAWVYERREGLVLAVTPERYVRFDPSLREGEDWAVHDNRPEDLLEWSGDSAETEAAIGHVARVYGRARTAGHTLHTLVVNGRLAAWGFSYCPKAGDVSELWETPGARLTFPSGATSLYAFHTIPEFRGRKLYQALLGEILTRRFAEGVSIAYIGVLASNVPSRVAIERVGFSVRQRNRFRRVFSGRILDSEVVEVDA